MKKTILVLLLSIISIISISSQNFGGGSGTSTDPYLIYTDVELKEMSDLVNSGDVAYNSAHYKLMDNIDLSAYSSGSGWEPIGKSRIPQGGSVRPFKGTFDGNNKVISNLYIGNQSNSTGLFSAIEGATIKNLGLEDVNINSEYYVGGLVGYAGTVTNEEINTISSCYVTGNINGGNSRNIGGIVGYAMNTNITNCYTNVQVSGDNAVGGIAGETRYTEISNCYSIGIINGSSFAVAGIVGDLRDESILSNSVALNYSISTQYASDYGRIAGRILDNSSVQNNLAYINMLNPDGEISWANVGSNTKNGDNLTVVELHSDGTINGLFINSNGWTAEDGKLPGLFDSTVDMPEYLSLEIIAPYITTTELPNGKVDMAYSQTLSANGTVPIEWSVVSGNLPDGLNFKNRVISGIPTLAGDFTFTIKAENEAGIDTKEFTLTIDEADLPPTITSTTLPDGEVGVEYSQTLEATGTDPIQWSIYAGSTISGLTLSSNGVLSGTPTIAGSYSFNVRATNLKGNEIKSIQITINGDVIPMFGGGSGTSADPYLIYTDTQLKEMSDLVNSGEYAYSSAHYKLMDNIDLSAYSSGSGWTPIGDSFTNQSWSTPFKGTFDGNNKVISNLYIDQSNSIGLFSTIEGATIKNLGLEDVNINSGSYAGGIVGNATVTTADETNTISSCYVTGNIDGDTRNRIGGIAGYANNTNITNCYTNVQVSGDYAVGGIAGEIRYSEVSNCYSIGIINGSSHAVAGIVGDLRHESILSNSVALNYSISTEHALDYGRIAGRILDNSSVQNNLAYNNMLNPDGEITWTNVSSNTKNGDNLTVAELYSDGTIDGLFINSNGWTTEDGKLPGLFGATVDMPEYLKQEIIAPTISTIELPNGKVDVTYTQTLFANGTVPIEWSIISGDLPDGLNFNNRVILGTPTLAGDFIFTVKAENEAGADTKEFTITIDEADLPPTITSTTIPDGKVGIEYSQVFEATGTDPIKWSFIGASNVVGLTISSNGVLSGTPNMAGTFSFLVKATNNVGSETKEFTIIIEESVGINENNIEELYIYPNPASNWLYFSQLMTCEIMDMHGSVLLNNRNFDNKINITNLPKGVYIIRLTSKTGDVEVKQFLKN